MSASHLSLCDHSHDATVTCNRSGHVPEPAGRGERATAEPVGSGTPVRRARIDEPLSPVPIDPIEYRDSWVDLDDWQGDEGWDRARAEVANDLANERMANEPRLGLPSIVASCVLMVTFVLLFAILLLAFVVGVTGWRP